MTEPPSIINSLKLKTTFQKPHISILRLLLFVPAQTTLPTTSIHRFKSVSKLILVIILTSIETPNPYFFLGKKILCHKIEF
jgi:hypothetical protein